MNLVIVANPAKRCSFIVKLLSAVLVTIFLSPLVVRAEEPISVSMMQLVTTPERYDGKLVRIEGYVHIKFEDSALYLSKEVADHLVSTHALWIDYRKDILRQPPNKSLNDFDGNWVLVEGTFDQKFRGHGGSYSGGLRDVSQIMELHRYYDGRKELKH